MDLVFDYVVKHLYLRDSCFSVNDTHASCRLIFAFLLSVRLHCSGLSFPFLIRTHLQVVAGGLLGITTAAIGHLIVLVRS